MNSSRLTVDPSQRLSDHFTVAEFCHSDIAERRNISNALPATLLPNAQRTAQMLERIRAELSAIACRDVPILLSSGYRCTELNRLVGSTSPAHPTATAADWTAPEFGTPQQICEALAPRVSVLSIGQLILEFGAWVHASWQHPMSPINRVLTIDRYRGTVRTRPGIFAVGK